MSGVYNKPYNKIKLITIQENQIFKYRLTNRVTSHMHRMIVYNLRKTWFISLIENIVWKIQIEIQKTTLNVN